MSRCCGVLRRGDAANVTTSAIPKKATPASDLTTGVSRAMAASIGCGWTTSSDPFGS
jgi:hypothetical protein